MNAKLCALRKFMMLYNFLIEIPDFSINGQWIKIQTLILFQSMAVGEIGPFTRSVLGHVAVVHKHVRENVIVLVQRTEGSHVTEIQTRLGHVT